MNQLKLLRNKKVVCGHGKIPKGITRPTEICGTLLEPGSLLDFEPSWICCMKAGAREIFQRQTAAASSRWGFKVQTAFIHSLFKTWGQFFFFFPPNKTLIFGRGEGILYTNCQLQEPSGQGIWLLKSCQTHL